MRVALVLLWAGLAWAEGNVRSERFDTPPHWIGLNNRSQAFEVRNVEQDFGYDAAVQVGEKAGAVGGTVTPAGEPSYYAKKFSELSFEKAFSASGKVRVEKGAGNTLLGFFNAGTINEWRTPNTIVFRLNGRGDTFHAHFEYATSKWRAGAGIIGEYDKVADRMHPIEIPSGGVHTWSIAYDPAGIDGRGLITATFDDYRAECALAEGHKADGATFNRFGILNVMKSYDSPGRIWISDLAINGETQDLGEDPHWDGLRNRETYESDNVRPRFNFGFSPKSQYAGGEAPGEVGGLFFRGDCRYPEKLAYYGAELEPLTMAKPLHASGKLALHRGVSDSTTLFGFFSSKDSVEVNPSQSAALPMSFFGISIEGPSAHGFFVYPAYRLKGGIEGSGYTPEGKPVYPDGASHSWALDYRPPADGAPGAIVLTLDGETMEMPVDSAVAQNESGFDRFGFVTPWIDGNGQVIYFDDLEFTERQ